MPSPSLQSLPCLVWLAVLAAVPGSLLASQPCTIRVEDAENGWPVPLVILTTTHQCRFVSDNNGVIAFDLPELMGVETWFSIKGHGYGVPKDGFGFAGVRLTPEPGKTLVVKVRRQLPAKRMGRITGGGIFGESQQAGGESAWREQGILGCDTVQTAIHNGKLFWLWGDTTLARYPLGIFDTLGGLTAVRPLKSLTPPVHLRYDYYKDGEGNPRAIAKMPGDGPTWLSGLTSLPASDGTSRLVAHYAKIRNSLTMYESGLCVWDETTDRFERFHVLWERTTNNEKAPVAPEGHVVFWRDAEGKSWVLFGDPYPFLRCPATFEAWSNPETWEKLTPQKSVPAAGGGKSVTPHRGAIAWNGFRKKWVSVFTRMGGEDAFLGEIWYAEADAPTGPWGPAVKVATHNQYTFYNPCLHPEFTPRDAPVLFFEGTYTQTFENKPQITPRYDYNQILYRLDLDDPALLEQLNASK